MRGHGFKIVWPLIVVATYRKRHLVNKVLLTDILAHLIFPHFIEIKRVGSFIINSRY